MKLAIVVMSGAQHQIETGMKIAEGCKRHGVAAHVGTSIPAGHRGPVCCWGWRNGRRYQARGHRVLVMERAYMADRFHWVSLGWDGLNGRATWPAIEDGGARWRQHFGDLLRPRKWGGDYALVLGQVAGDAAVTGVDLNAFYRQAGLALRERFGLPVLFRPHPVAVQRSGQVGTPLFGMPVLGGSLDAALENAVCAVAWNSNALTDAALAGVPVAAMDEGAMVWPIAGHGLQAAPLHGDRLSWAQQMAWRQWLPEELASGAAWAAVGSIAADEVRVAS